MLRITEISSSGEEATLLLEGRITGPWADEVRRVCREYLAAGTRLVLDLSEVSFIGREDRAVFEELCSHRVKIINCSPFLAEHFREIRGDCQDQEQSA